MLDPTKGWFSAQEITEAKRQGIEPRKGGILVPTSIFEKRATQTTTTNAATVPDDYRADQFIGLLRNSLIVKSLGARVLTGLRGDTARTRPVTKMEPACAAIP